MIKTYPMTLLPKYAKGHVIEFIKKKAKRTWMRHEELISNDIELRKREKKIIFKA